MHSHPWHCSYFVGGLCWYLAEQPREQVGTAVVWLHGRISRRLFGSGVVEAFASIKEITSVPMQSCMASSLDFGPFAKGEPYKP